MITETPFTALERRTVFSLALLYSFRMLGLFMVLPLLALYTSDLSGATPALIGLALGIYGLSQALLQLPFGWLSDWIGRKPVIVGGLIIFALGSLVAAQAETIQEVVFGRLLQGAGAIAGTVMALLADLTRAEQRTKAMAVVGMSIGMSFAVALIAGPVIAAFGGLSAVFLVTAAFAVMGIIIVLFLVPAPEQRGTRHKDVGARIGLIGSTLKDGMLQRLDFGVFALHFVLMASFLVVPGVLESELGFARELHWQVYLPTLILSIAGMVPLMILAERRKRPREVFAFAIALLLAALALIGLSASTLVLCLALWLFFVGFNYLEATLPSLVSKTVREDGKGTALGLFSTCQFLGAFAGGAIGGWLMQEQGVAGVIYLSLGVLLVWLVVSLSSRELFSITEPVAADA